MRLPHSFAPALLHDYVYVIPAKALLRGANVIPAQAGI